MRLTLLGPVELAEDDGTRVNVGSKRLRQLLAIFGLYREQVVTTETISDLIWGESPPADPNATVQTTVSRLRRVLTDPLAIGTSAQGYVFTCPESSLDLAEFESLVARVRSAEVDRIPELAQQALALWRTHRLLADLDHPDIESERQRLTEMRLEVTESLADSLRQLGRYAEAIELIEGHIREHPYRERPVAILMRALYATGRQAEALAAFSNLRDTLREELGVDPSSALQDLELAILQQDLDEAGPLSKAPQLAIEQRIRICTTEDGTRLAYALSGSGPPLVKAANWMTHLDYDWESPVWKHWNESLSRTHTLIRYDERGCGLSDWEVDRFSFDAWVDDLASVADALNLERFPLLGVSQGGAVAISYAVRHPERVSSLVLFGAYPRGRLVRATSEEERREAALHLELARVGWGTGDPAFRQVFSYQFMPDGDSAQWAEFNELQRRTCSPENAVRFMEVFAGIDVTEMASQVRCPTLILHSRDEIRVPFTNALELASLIPDSELVPLESRNHILIESEPAWPKFLADVELFLAAHR